MPGWYRESRRWAHAARIPSFGRWIGNRPRAPAERRGPAPAPRCRYTAVRNARFRLPGSCSRLPDPAELWPALWQPRHPAEAAARASTPLPLAAIGLGRSRPSPRAWPRQQSRALRGGHDPEGRARLCTLRPANEGRKHSTAAELAWDRAREPARTVPTPWLDRRVQN